MRLLVSLALASAACAAHGHPAAAPAPTAAPAPADGYDPALAARLGADELGMHPYVMALLKAGPNRDQPPAEAQALMAAHLANIERMAAAGTLVLAGPFLDDSELAGVYVFDVRTVEEAAALTATDPAIKAGRLVMELHPWYGSAALRELAPIHRRIQRKRLGE